MADVIDPGPDDPRLTLRALGEGFQIAQGVSVMARLGIADQLADGARTSDELAALAGADPGALYRLLRAPSASRSAMPSRAITDTPWAIWNPSPRARSVSRGSSGPGSMTSAMARPLQPVGVDGPVTRYRSPSHRSAGLGQRARSV